MGNCCTGNPELTIPMDEQKYVHTTDESTEANLAVLLSQKKLVLSPKGYLADIPSWFPPQNAHKDIKKSFDKHEVIGKGMSGIYNKAPPHLTFI